MSKIINTVTTVGNIIGSTHTTSNNVLNSAPVVVNRTVAASGADYSSLKNKPQINGVTLDGNKTFEDLLLPTLTNFEIEQMLR